MKSWIVYGLVAILGIGLALLVTMAIVARGQAHDLINNPREVRAAIDTSPADYGLPYEDVTVTSEDGFRLAGWYIPSKNGAVIMAQHGLKSNRMALLEEAEMLQNEGVGFLQGRAFGKPQMEPPWPNKSAESQATDSALEHVVAVPAGHVEVAGGIHRAADRAVEAVGRREHPGDHATRRDLEDVVAGQAADVDVARRVGCDRGRCRPCV